MRLYWDSHALFLLGTSLSATRLLGESASQGHRLLTSSWAISTPRENLKREEYANIPRWEASLERFQQVEDHSPDPTLDLPRLFSHLMTAAIDAKADRFLSGDPAVRDLFPEYRFRGIRIMTLGEWMRELHNIATVVPQDPERNSTVQIQTFFQPKKKRRG